MPAPKYKPGDTLVMRSGLTHSSMADRTCTVVGVLPSDYGRFQYRVRFEHENFERRVVEADVDIDETPTTSRGGQPREKTAAPMGKSWLKPLTTKPGK
ncbi:hypothetical protein QO002_003041 [Pararhizobium capsulatum DSM 1112]|uniref:Cold-shock protein n=1 Tax=Pararhizobium capsulatum DSM 1112 TaxID=1121113 RepID=A0ABU0BSG2_9HYPH|nr:cold-shock protein [Pararhizobium capsulatum]MDQ0320903.1 hypothetical protein [Pararhizobium capsulatum DSM 1112]